MKLTYGIKDKPNAGQLVIFAFQQLLAILAATIVVPVIINGNIAGLEKFGGVPGELSQAAALFGAGVGTLVYLLFTKCKSPVFLGSSFAFLGSMTAAFAGAATMKLGYLGLIIGAILAGLVYVVIALVVKVAGVGWINKLMPAVVIGPTVAIIGLSLAGNAVGDALSFAADGHTMNLRGWIGLICALVTLFTVMICSVFGKKMAKLIPFIIGIAAGYVCASIFTLIGMLTKNADMQIMDWSAFAGMKILSVPDFTFIKGFSEFKNLSGTYLAGVAVAYVPVAFVVFAEHIADHKNLSSIIGKDLLEDPGLNNTLLGDGVGSMVGAFFGGCPNTTYGESIGCVAITGNASVVTILATSVLAIIASFIDPFVTVLSTIPSCVMGGVCIALYGFIAVSGLKMIQKVDLDQNKNLFVVSVILIAGVGGMFLQIGKVYLTEIAAALILGIIANIILSRKKDDAPVLEEAVEEPIEEIAEGATEEAAEVIAEEAVEEVTE
ncbi:MAG: uracil-xanthine permease [Clostridia bacterium]|nr:uracil-xanthine permease [Clostridia bacterium]